MAHADTVWPMHREHGDGRQLRVITDLVTITATAADVAGAYCLYESVTPPSGGCPPHLQRYEDEAIYVLEGRYRLLLGDEEIDAGPGAVVFIPRGTVHGFVNTGREPARMLVLVTPGGIQEAFLNDVGDDSGRPAWEADMARVLAVAPKYGVEFMSWDTYRGA